MRSAAKWAVVLGLVLATAGTADAQGRGQGRGRGGMFGGRGGMSPAMLLNSQDVQKELKLTDEQKEKVTKFGEEQREKMREAFQDAQGDREKMQDLMRKSAEAGEKFVKDTLKPEQQKRLHQIQLQAGGVQTFNDEKVQKELNLTDAQKEKLKTLSDDLNKDRQELFQGGGGAETMQKMQALNKEYLTKAQDVLNAEQKTKWKEMTGEPFTGQVFGGFRGRRGGGGQ